MKNITLVFLALIALTSCQEQAKIGFIDNGKVINDYQEKKDLEEKYKQKDAAFVKTRDSIGQVYNMEAQTVQFQLSKLSLKKQQEGSQEFTKKWQLIQQKLQFDQQEMLKAFNTEMDSVMSKVKGFVKDYGKKNNYTYILGKNEAGSVMYGKEEDDISQIIIDALNADYKKE
jgi:outer membrane protein